MARVVEDTEERQRLSELCADCMLLIIHLHVTKAIDSAEKLRRNIKDLLDDLDRKARRARYETEEVQNAKFALVAGHAERGVRQLRAEGLHHGVLPMLDAILDDPERQRFLHAALHDTDERIRQDQSASPAFMLACLLWFEMQHTWQTLIDQGEPPQAALFAAMDDTLERQRDALAFPRRFDGMIKEIWALQSRFDQRSGGRPYRC